MRFRGTLVLLLICAALGVFVYFYEIKGGENREKAKQEANQLWKVESANIEQIDLITPQEHITAVRKGDKEWKLTEPRAVDADSDELNRMAGSAAEITRESVLESNVTDLARFGLQPPQLTLEIKTKDGKKHEVLFGENNPTGNSTYATVPGSKEVMLVAGYTASSFKKKFEDLRNRAVLNFEQYETNSLDLQSDKGNVRLAKENDKWWLQGKERVAADSSAVSGLLSTLNSARVKEFFEGNPDDYVSLGFDKPTLDVRLTFGKDRAIKHLTVGLEKSKLVRKGQKPAKPGTARKAQEKPATTGTADTDLYLARDESRPEMFFVDKELLDKLRKGSGDFRDKALASFQRWDIDAITLTNARGTFNFAKSESGGDWVLAGGKKKARWDAVNGILDALEKPVKEFIDAPAALSTYGLDKPSVRVVLKQKGQVKLECDFGKDAKDGVYAQVKGETTVKVADKESLDKLDKGESDLVEPPAATPPATAPSDSKKK
jgi:hypothetical protein